jgi:hypothetical protein
MSDVLLVALPKMDRLRLKVVLGSLKMLQGELAELPPDVLAACFGTSSTEMIALWRQNVETTYNGSADEIVPPPERPKTME